MTKEQQAEIERLLPAVEQAFIASGVSASMSPIYEAYADAKLAVEYDAEVYGGLDYLIERLRRYAS